MLPAAVFAQRRDAAPYGLVAGSVFDPSGRTLPQALATLIPDPQPDSAAVKLKKLSAVSDSRGEFVIRVPAIRMHYVLRVAAKGFLPLEKPVDIVADERADVTFQLEPESKK